VVWALAVLGHDPGPAWMAFFQERAAGRPGVPPGPTDEASRTLPAGAGHDAGVRGAGAAPGLAAAATAPEALSRVVLQGIVAWASQRLGVEGVGGVEGKRRGEVRTKGARRALAGSVTVG
jgi:hypothetical protein